jgi:hypothetical protein
MHAQIARSRETVTAVAQKGGANGLGLHVRHGLDHPAVSSLGQADWDEIGRQVGKLDRPLRYEDVSVLDKIL